MPVSNGSKTGSLVVVGTGIRLVGQLTIESIAWMKRADKLLHLVGDPVFEEAVRQWNPAGSESLNVFYGDGKDRLTTYLEMVERVLACVRSGQTTCLAAYGHPGVFAFPTHESVRRARAEGYPARMLPAVSAEDCLFADLGIDPGRSGCQSYEATDFLANGRVIDPSSVVILWQIGAIGDPTYKADGRYDLSALPLLVERLVRLYPADHTAYLYHAAVFLGEEPLVQSVALRDLARTPIPTMATLCLPPCRPPSPDPYFAYRVQELLARRRPPPPAPAGTGG